jgi:hypothetical protein
MIVIHSEYQFKHDILHTLEFNVAEIKISAWKLVIIVLIMNNNLKTQILHI